MMVIVPHAIFIESHRTNGLNLAKDSALDHRRERVVDRLLGDRTEVLCCHRCNVLGGGVRVAVHGAQHGKTLRGYWQAMGAQCGERVKEHMMTVAEIWTESKSWKTVVFRAWRRRAGLVGAGAAGELGI